MPTPDNLLPLIEKHRITSSFAPPTVWISLLRSPLFDKTDLTSLRKGHHGASIMPVEVLREMRRRLPQDEGYITIVDRKKDMIKSGGENVASREVEENNLRHRGGSEVAVIGLPHPRWVEAVTAVIVVKQGQRLTADAVISHCSRRIATFKVPKDVLFLQALPKNPSGKLLKRELRRQLRGHFNPLVRPIGSHESSA